MPSPVRVPSALLPHLFDTSCCPPGEPIQSQLRHGLAAVRGAVELVEIIEVLAPELVESDWTEEWPADAAA